MKAMIFAAGLGSRLKPLTDTRPKALVEVGGVPVLGRVIERLKSCGFDELTVNVHHFAPMICDYLAANGNFGVTVHVSDESGLLLDTGGGIVKASRWLEGSEPVLVHNVDIVSDIDFRELMKAHEETGADATLLVSERDTSRYFLFDDDMRLKGWTNVKTGEVRPAVSDIQALRRKAFGGIHVISPKVIGELKHYTSEPKFSITPFYIDTCDRLDFRGFTPSGGFHWWDIGKPETLEAARQAYAEGDI